MPVSEETGVRRTATTRWRRHAWWSFGTLLAVCGVSIAVQLLETWYADTLCGDKLAVLVETPLRMHRDDVAFGAFLCDFVVRDRDLEPFVRPQDLVVETHGNSRRVRLSYVRPITILPSWRLNLRFQHDVRGPAH